MKKRSVFSILPALPALVLALASAGARAEESLLVIPERGAGDAQGALSALALRKIPGIQSSEALFDSAEARSLSELGEEDLARAVKLTVVPGRKRAILAFISDFIRRNRLPLKVEANSIVVGLDSPSEAFGPATLENLQWGLHNSGAPQKLAIDDLTTIDVPGRAGEDIGLDRALPERMPGPNGKRIIVAILDTGIDYGHPSFQGQILRKPSECDALDKYKACLKSSSQEDCDKRLANLDTDGNGYPMDCSGWNLTSGKNSATGITGNPDASDDTGHGTHVAGIIGAALGSGKVRGVTQNVSILPVKVIRTSPNAPIRPQSDDGAGPSVGKSLPNPNEKDLQWTSGFADLIARGMLYAIRSGAQVINLSLAWPAGVDSPIMRRMVELARSRGILVVAAAGNDSADARVMPCEYPGVVCVASHGPDGALSHFSNYGSFVDVAAPGLDILSAWPLDKRSVNFTAWAGYESKNGTSMASPFVVGILARLLEEGYGPDEAYARLLAGARKIRAPSIAGPTQKFITFGNVDLAESLAARPRPLIAQAAKSVIELDWDRRTEKLPFKVELKNFWAAGRHVHLRASLNSPGAHLSRSRFGFGYWAAGATRELSSAVVVDHPGALEGRMILDFEVLGAGQTEPAHFSIPVEISVAATPSLGQVLPIRGAALSPTAELRSVSAMDGLPGQDYLSIDSSGDSSGPDWKLTLLRERSGSSGRFYDVSGTANLPAVGGDLLLIDRVDLYQNGKTSYVLIFRLPPPMGAKVPAFRFLFFDESLKLLETQDYDNSTSVVSERFQWLRISGPKGARLCPAWLDLGPTPPLDQAPASPWDPTPEEDPKYRLYYLAPEGLHQVAAPDKQMFAQVLTPSPEERKSGSVPVLLASGDEYDMSYELATVSDGKLGQETALTLPRFRMLMSLDNLLELTSIGTDRERTGTALSGPEARGTQRTGFLLNGSTELDDSTQTPPTLTDSIMRISGAFVGNQLRSVFAETHYLLQYNDLNTGEIATTNLDRFSYLPAFIFSRSFFPVVVSPSPTEPSGDPIPGGDRLPGLMIPSSLGVSDATEIIVPRYAAGRLQGLSRPAWLRVKESEGCQALGNAVPATTELPTELVFFCGNEFVRIPLLLP